MLTNSIKRTPRGAILEQLTKGSPSATVGFSSVVTSRGFGMPDAVRVELSSEPGSYSGASGDFATYRLEPLEEILVELMGFDDGGRLPCRLSS